MSILEYMVATAIEAGVSITLEYNETVDYNGTPCSGFFDPETNTIAVATKKPQADWVPILIHEYCHMKQWKEKAQVALNFDNHPSSTNEEGRCLDAWIRGECELTPEEIESERQVIIDLELDCEQRTVDMLAAFNVNVDLTEYIQKANSYLYFYHIMTKTRKWYEAGKQPYNTPAIWSKMPIHFDNDYTVIPPEIECLFQPKESNETV